MTAPSSADQNWHVLQVATHKIEREYPVEEWTIDGVRIWPLVKADMSAETYAVWRPQTATTEQRRLRDRFPIRPALEIYRTTSRRRAARRADAAGEARLGRADVLFYSDGASFVLLDGSFYERVCDPLLDLVVASGRTATMLTPLSLFHHPRRTPSVFVQPRLDAARVEARLRHLARARLGRLYPARLDGWDGALATLRADVPTVRIGDRARYDTLVSYLHAYERAFGQMLDRVRPKIVAIVCYYAIEPMALIRACRARGIATIDLQHGSINEIHHAYAGRHRFPRGGMDLVPDAFWVARDAEAETIRRWTRDSPDAPQTIVGGNLFLEMWRDERRPFVRDAAAKVSAIKARHPNLTHVVYTLQGLLPARELAHVAAAVRRSTDRYFWWFRMHPSQVHARAEAQAQLATLGTENFLLQAHTEIPLYGVLPHMAAHVTYSSSTVSEAAALGVPSVLTSDDERAMHELDIASGWATVCGPEGDLAAAIDAQIRRADELRAAGGSGWSARSHADATRAFLSLRSRGG